MFKCTAIICIFSYAPLEIIPINHSSSTRIFSVFFNFLSICITPISAQNVSPVLHTLHPWNDDLSPVILAMRIVSQTLSALQPINNELYLRDHTSTYAIAKAIFKNQSIEIKVNFVLHYIASTKRTMPIILRSLIVSADFYH